MSVNTKLNITCADYTYNDNEIKTLLKHNFIKY